MNSSLSMVLPVHNVQATLQKNVQRVIEILPELTHRFEVLIVDDGSTDATYEVAHELARDYPQILVVRNAKTLGWAAAAVQQVDRTRGEFLMTHSGGELRPEDVAGLWRLRKGIADAVAMNRPTSRARKLWRLDPKVRGSTDAEPAGPADRHVSGSLGVHARAPRSNLLLVHRQQLGELKRSLAALPNIPWPTAAAGLHHQGSSQVKRPSFLRRVRRFALGE